MFPGALGTRGFNFLQFPFNPVLLTLRCLNNSLNRVMCFISLSYNLFLYAGALLCVAKVLERGSVLCCYD